MANQAKQGDLQEISRTLAALYQIDDCVELRVLGGRLYENTAELGTLSGFYNDMAALRADAMYLSGFSGGQFYVTVNPVGDHCLTISNNAVRKAAMTTSDHWVARRRWILVDCDPARAAGFEKQSATDDEKESASLLADTIHDWLILRGWSDIIVADSGNGWHLLIPVDFDNDAESTILVRNFLAALGNRFNTEQASVDPVVFNAARITKLYGTWAAKGDDTDDRPHRLSRLDRVPEIDLETGYKNVTPAQVQAVIDELGLPQSLVDAGGRAASDKPATPHGTGKPGEDFNSNGDVLGVLTEAGWTVHSRKGEVVFLTRPGKTEGVSATLGYANDRDLYVFSSSDPVLAHGSHSPFHVYAVLKHGGDYGAAARQLRSEGYGGETAESDEDIDKRCAYLKQTDLGNAERFAARYSSVVKWIDSQQTWAVWTGKYWERQATTTAVLRAAANTARAIQDEIKTLPPEKTALADTLIKHARRTEGRGGIVNITECAKLHDDIKVNADAFDAATMFLTVNNGVINLEDPAHTLMAHNPDFMLTSILPVDFDPKAKASTWDKFIADVLPDADVRRYVQKWLGYALSADTSNQTFLFFFGNGANGKGTMIDTLRAVYGDLHTRIHSCVITMNDQDNGAARFGLAPIVGKRLVTFSELASGARLNESLIKDLTGQDPVWVEKKGVDGYSVQPIAKYILIGNHKPNVKGDDHGIWRRVRLIPFLAKFDIDKRDEKLREKLLGELPGVLNWLLEGFDAYRSEGLIAPKAIMDATDGYRVDSDVFGQFLGDYCQVKEGKEEPGSLLYLAYQEWCRANGQQHPLSNKSFASKMKDRGFVTKKTKTSNLWLGIRALRYDEREKGEVNDEDDGETGDTMSPTTQEEPAVRQTGFLDLPQTTPLASTTIRWLVGE